MKLLLTATILFLSGLTMQAQEQKNAKTDTTATKVTVEYVHVCNGTASKKYHRTANCRGLRNCSTSIEKLAKTQATAKGRTACAICYKKKPQATTYDYRPSNRDQRAVGSE